MFRGDKRTASDCSAGAMCASVLYCGCVLLGCHRFAEVAGAAAVAHGAMSAILQSLAGSATEVQEGNQLRFVLTT